MKYQELRDALEKENEMEQSVAIAETITPDTLRALLADADRAEDHQEAMGELCDAVDVMMEWLVKNVNKWSFIEYDYLHTVNENARAALSQGDQT